MDCLPEVIMPEPNIEITIEDEDAHKSDINANGTKAEREAEEDEEEEPKQPKRLLEQGDIFSDTPKVKKVNEKKTKKKRVLSEEHKAKLALARQKALEVRRANSKQKKEMKELTKLKKQQELERLREETGTKKTTPKKVVDTPIASGSALEPSPPSMVEQPKSQPVSIPKQPSQKIGYSQEDLEKATLNAIMGYEKIRKKRKEVKKQEQKERVEQEALKKQLREITTKQKPTYETNPWSDFF